MANGFIDLQLLIRFLAIVPGLLPAFRCNFKLIGSDIEDDIFVSKIKKLH